MVYQLAGVVVLVNTILVIFERLGVPVQVEDEAIFAVLLVHCYDLLDEASFLSDEHLECVEEDPSVI